MRRHPDGFSRRARREGFHARSVYKLQEIDRRFQLIRRGQRVLDLGCSPGSWLQHALKAVGPKGEVVGVDLKAISPISAPNLRVLKADIYQISAELLGGGFHVILSDMAPATSGQRFRDHVRSVELVRRAWTLSQRLLEPGGAFVAKVFEGPELEELVREIRPQARRFKRFKPKSTRSESVELFMIAQGITPVAGNEAPGSEEGDPETER